MKAYTDYPVTELGDIAGKIAPIREVEIIAYDKSLYCTIIVEGVEKDVKSGYIYTESGRYGEVLCVPIDQLEKLPDIGTIDE